MALSGLRVLLAGATGLVGGSASPRCWHDAISPGVVVAPVRRPAGRSDSRLVAPSVTLPRRRRRALAAAVEAAGARPLDAYVCCLGTTLRAAGSREAFLAVDRDLVLRLAQLAHSLGASTPCWCRRSAPAASRATSTCA
jgi:uncharacterized protein YbjT (DUF2867 family)